MTIKLRTIGMVVLAGLVLVMGAAALFVYSGIYNIAATVQHTKPVYQLLDYAMRRSVKARADVVSVPDLQERQRILRGTSHYRQHCLQCHGAPGVAPHSLAYGMTPAPANLVGTAREWPAAEIYWVIKNGIKMSGMPAWEYRLNDAEIWDIVAFVVKLPTLSPVEYVELDQEASKTHPHLRASGSEVDEQAAQSGSTNTAPPHRSDANLPQRSVVEGRQDPNSPPPVREDEFVNGYQIGNVEAGRQAVSQYLCVTCHQIPGIVGANRHVGPPLNGIAKRRYIGGVIINNPENMVRWLQDPKQFDPLSAMPNMGITEKDARDMAAFLYTLEDLD